MQLYPRPDASCSVSRKVSSSHLPSPDRWCPPTIFCRPDAERLGTCRSSVDEGLLGYITPGSQAVGSTLYLGLSPLGGCTQAFACRSEVHLAVQTLGCCNKRWASLRGGGCIWGTSCWQRAAPQLQSALRALEAPTCSSSQATAFSTPSRSAGCRRACP